MSARLLLVKRTVLVEETQLLKKRQKKRENFAIQPRTKRTQFVHLCTTILRGLALRTSCLFAHCKESRYARTKMCWLTASARNALTLQPLPKSADAAPCTQCTPSITSPGTVCAECKSALANAVRACNLPAASPAPPPPPPPAPTPAPPPPCRCKHKWSYGAKTFTGCAKTPDEDEPWCYLEEACSGSAPSSQFIGWHWADCNAEEYLATVAESNVCAGLARNKCKKVGEDVCRWLPGKAKGCFEAGGDLPCKAFPTSWKCKNGNGGNSCQWWKNKCVDTLLCDKGTSECCGKGQKQCWKVKDACTFVRLSTCMPRLQ